MLFEILDLQIALRAIKGKGIYNIAKFIYAKFIYEVEKFWTLHKPPVPLNNQGIAPANVSPALVLIIYNITVSQRTYAYL